ncbi:mavicyanin-like [Aristolochia californica]|uniref:mavicyanin-like n=1 Tax=Aristolochia californica TaxID=171875 RepID=UPI0035D5ABBF
MQRLYRDMKHVVVVAVLILVVVDPPAALAAKHVVGGSQGWDTSADLSSWASGQTFEVGDQLVFRYTPGFHSVVELPSQKEYEKCEMSGALDSMNGGTSVVKLDKPGTRYFTCGTLGHCDQGMKVKIKVVASNDSASSKSPSTASVASSTPASASTSSASVNCVRASSVSIALFLAIGWFGMV